MSQMAMEYVLLVLAKYLQMMVAYSIFKEDQDRVTILFETFNKHFTRLNQVFEEVTGETFQPGQEITLPSKPVAPVKPTVRKIKPVLRVSNEEVEELEMFLARNGLEDLRDVFHREGVKLNDVLSMGDDDMKDIGIQSFSVRKSLKQAIRSSNGDSSRSHPTARYEVERSVSANGRDVPDAPRSTSSGSRNPSSGPRTFVILGFGGEVKDVKVLCPKGHVMSIGKLRVNWTCSSKQNCVSDCGERDVSPHEGINSWACIYGTCSMVLCESCTERQKVNGTKAEFEIQCPWNHKMNRYPPSEDRDEAGDWQCDFPPQGDCVAGIGEVGSFGSYPELEVWRCIEDSRVKAGGECNADLCGTCVEAMKQRARINLKTSLQKQLTPTRSNESSCGKLFFKVCYD